jgi:hypothetical protein
LISQTKIITNHCRYDKSGKSTYFIEYMLDVIDKSLESLLYHNNRILKDLDRLEFYKTWHKRVLLEKII